MSAANNRTLRVGAATVAGTIDGSGTTVVNAGSHLMADHVIQSALVIGGTASSPATVTIDASDSSGNPLATASEFALAGSLEPTAPFGAGIKNSPILPAAGDSPAGNSVGDNSGFGRVSPVGSLPTVPEPSTLLLAAMGSLALLGLDRRASINRRSFRVNE